MAKLKARYRTAADREDGNVSGYAGVFYDPTRRPARRYVTLRTKNEETARRRLAALEKREALGTFDPWGDASPEAGVTVGEAAQRYVKAQKRAGRSENTVGAATRLLTQLENALPIGSLINHVERRHVEAFLGQRRKNGEPRSASTVKRYKAVISHFFGFCVKRGLRPDDPTAGVETAPVQTNRRDHLTEAEEAAMHRAISAAEVLDGRSRRWLSDWIRFGTRTGLRPSEQAGLTWASVDLAESVVHVGRDGRVKTAASARTVPVRGAALDVLQRLAEERVSEDPAELVFKAARGGRVEMRSLSKRLSELAEAAKITKRITAYSLRHSAGTRLALAGTPLFIISRVLGTSVAMIERHYAAYAPDAGAAHLERAFGHPAGGGSEDAPERGGDAARTSTPAGTPAALERDVEAAPTAALE